MKNLIKTVVFLLLIFSVSAINAQEKIKKYADNNLSEVSYAMSHPLHDWKGVDKNVRAVIVENKENGNIEKVAVSLKVADFNSDNANRDSHAVEVLDGIKYPTVTFVSKSVEQKDNDITVTGILTFHNVKKEIKIPVLKKEENGKEFYSGMFDVDMTEYGIKQPSLMNMPADKIIKMSFFIVF